MQSNNKVVEASSILKPIYEFLLEDRRRDNINTDGEKSCCFCSSSISRISTGDRDSLIRKSRSVLILLVKSLLPEHFNEEEEEQQKEDEEVDQNSSFFFCFDCSSLVDQVVELVEALKRTREEFLSVRERLAEKVIRNFDVVASAVDGKKDEMDKDNADKTFLCWKESIKKIEHIYPDLAYRFIGPSSSAEELSRPLPSSPPSLPDVNDDEDRLDDLNIFIVPDGMVEIKEEPIEDDDIITDANWIPPESEEPNLDEFIVHPLLGPSSPNNLDMKLIEMNPVVVLERINTVSENKKLPRRRGRPPKSKLKSETKKCDILKPEKIEVIEGLTSNFDMDDDNNFEPPMKSSINCEDKKSPYIPPWDWNLTELPSARLKRCSKNLLETLFEDGTFHDDGNDNDQGEQEYNPEDPPSGRPKRTSRSAAPKSFRSFQDFVDPNDSPGEEDDFVPSDINPSSSSSSSDEDDVSSGDEYLIEAKRPYVDKQPKKKISTDHINTDAATSSSTSIHPVRRPRIKKAITTVHDLKETLQLDEDGEPKRYECRICSISFSTVRARRKHLQLHKKDMPFKCHYCPKRFLMSISLKEHESWHKNDQPWVCDHCDARFIQKRGLNRHRIRKHCLFNPEENHQCELCLRMFDGLSGIKCHIEERHGGFQPPHVNIKCYYCDLKPSFMNKEELKEHAETDAHKLAIEGKRNIHCSLCRIKFSWLDELKDHLVSDEHSNERRRMAEVDGYTYCPICRLSFATRAALVDHQKTEPHKVERAKWQLDAEDEWLCSYCGREFDNKKKLKAHQKLEHSEKIHQCEFCGKSFSRQRDFKAHLRCHAADKPFECPTCGKKFAVKASLRQHMHTHEEDRSFMCSECGKIYRSNESLTRHIACLHRPPEEGTKYLSTCPHCQKNFPKPNFVRKHMAQAHPEIFLKDKPFPCKVCWHPFGTELLLEQHMAVHDGLKCTYCGKQCLMKTHLIKHLRIHTGERPFRCTICEKTFTCDSNLKEHTYRHTGERPHKCSLCGMGFLRRGEMEKHKTNCDHSPDQHQPQPHSDLLTVDTLESNESTRTRRYNRY